MLGALGFGAVVRVRDHFDTLHAEYCQSRQPKSISPRVLISSDGKRLATLKPMNREWVRLNRISPHVINALIATEDHRFYDHHGIDVRRSAAGHSCASSPAIRRAAPRLTQQLARNLYPGGHRPKADAHAKNQGDDHRAQNRIRLYKKEILETYLNTMPFLYNAFGIEMAARTYFDKPAQKLDVLESATLIAMLKGTSYYNPVLNPERALRAAQRGAGANGQARRVEPGPNSIG